MLTKGNGTMDIPSICAFVICYLCNVHSFVAIGTVNIPWLLNAEWIFLV